jgi:phosphonoacetate hydrolase
MNRESGLRREHGPERRGGQGLDPHQYDSGDAAILALLAESPAAGHVDLAITWRADAYEVWSRRGMIRFKRFADDRGALSFEVVEQIGENPIANQDPFIVSTIADELDAAARSGNRTDDPNRAYFEPHVLSHPYAYERIAQLFDSPRAPDLIVSPKAYAWGIQAGQHGALDVVQCRAPLIFSGPGVRRGLFKLNARHVDIAPTIARIAGLPKIAGLDASGAPAEVYLKRQDGQPLDEIIDGDTAPQRVYMILLDGQTHSELRHQLDSNPDAIPNLAGLVDRGAMLSHGSIVNFPSITWPSHSTILTGAWCGHHDVVNPTFHLREHRETVPIQGNIYDGERYLSPEVETLYEVFKRAGGDRSITASIHEPQGRGADHAVFERRIVGDKARLKALTAEMASDISPRWAADNIPAMTREEIVDIRGMAQLIALLEHCADDDDKAPTFIAHEFVLTDGAGHDYGPHHEGTREALYRTDNRIGAVLELFRARGLLDSTLFVVTSDHGMAAQRVELKANPIREPQRAGIEGVYAEAMIYLRDLRVEIDRARDHRSIAVTVLDNDALPDGEQPPLAGARVTLRGPGNAVIAETRTPESGRAAFATPADLSDAELTVSVELKGFNPRTLRADGTSLAKNIREILYPNQIS